MPKKCSKPAYTLHKPTGQARVRINGRDHYLGPYGSPESRERYDDLIAEWFARRGDIGNIRLRVDDLCLLYLEHARQYYVKNGCPTSEQSVIRIALRYVVEKYGRVRAREFGPKALKDVRQAMIDDGHCRSSINIHMGRIRRMFKWAVEDELLPPTMLTALQAVAGLRAGRTKAKESAPVKPVPDAWVQAVKPHLSRQVWGMIELQILTGMRPGEVMAMRGCDLSTSGKVWEYVPESHKTEHHGHRRVIFIGPKAQDALRPFLKTDTTAYLFSPADALAEFHARRRHNRQTPLTLTARKQKAEPLKRPGERYTVYSYRRAIVNACEVAFGMPDELRRIEKTIRKLSPAKQDSERERLRKLAAAWRHEHCWHPHQLRHNAGTLLRREAGIETARCVLGHASAVTTEIYAEADLAKAREIIGRVG